MMQPAAFDEGEGAFHGLLLTRAGQRIGVVEILTGILEGIPVRHLHPRNLGVVELLIRSPGRTIVQIFLSLNVVGRFLVARRRLVAEPADMVIEGLPSRLDLDCLEVHLNLFSPSSLVCPSIRFWTSQVSTTTTASYSSCPTSPFSRPR